MMRGGLSTAEILVVARLWMSYRSGHAKAPDSTVAFQACVTHITGRETGASEAPMFSMTTDLCISC
jgi:hypothetical protein